MKKAASFILGLALLGSFSSLSAQDTFEKGVNVIQATIGFPQFYGLGYRTVLPAVTMGYDRCIVDDLIDGNASVGVGGFLGIAGSRTINYDYTYLGLGLRGAFHYQFVDDLDTYSGIIIGGVIRSSNEVVTNTPYPSDSSGPIAGVFVGARYYFTDNFAGAAELGYGIALLNVGVAFSF